MIKVREATDEDIIAAAANPLPIFQNGQDNCSGMRNCLKRGVALSLFDKDDNLIGVLGGYLIWRGVASIGAIFTPHLKKNPVQSVKKILEILALSETRFKLHRVEMYVQADYRTGHKWAGVLNFQPEGTLRKFGPDAKDFVIYGRV